MQAPVVQRSRGRLTRPPAVLEGISVIFSSPPALHVADEVVLALLKCSGIVWKVTCASAQVMDCFPSREVDRVKALLCKETLERLDYVEVCPNMRVSAHHSRTARRGEFLP